MKNRPKVSTRLRSATRSVRPQSFIPAEIKDHCIRLRVTEKEHDDIKSCAEELGLTVSSLLLQLFYHAKPKL